MLLPALALLFVQDKTETKGKSYAQILAMGRAKWHDFYVGGEAGTTVAEVDAAGIYGEALGWRNDRLDKARAKRLRGVLEPVRANTVELAEILDGSGSLWRVVGASTYADEEETVYALLTKSGKAPARRASDVDRRYAAVRSIFAKASPKGEDAKRGRGDLASLRKALDKLVAGASRLPRKESDAMLDFAVRSLAVVTGDL